MKTEQLSSLFELIETGEKHTIDLAFQLAKSQQLDWESLLFKNYFPLIDLLKMGGKKIRFSKMTKKNTLALIQLCHQTTFLNIRNQNIPQLPVTIHLLKNLEELRILESEMLDIPYTIGKLTNLQEISFFDNKITQLPSSISNLKKLKKLNLSLNPLTNIPLKSLQKLPQLHFLDFEGTNIKMNKEELHNYLSNQITILI